MAQPGRLRSMWLASASACAHRVMTHDRGAIRGASQRSRSVMGRDVEMITCEGCGNEVDVTRQRGTPLIVERSGDDRQVVTVRIGRDEVHRCDRASNGSHPR